MLLASYSEPLLKSRGARMAMEKLLTGNMRSALAGIGANAQLEKEGGLILVKTDKEEEAFSALSKIFGISKLSIAKELPSSLPEISEECVSIARNFNDSSTFAIRAARTGATAFGSEQAAAFCGKEIQEKLPGKKLAVQLRHPENEIHLNIRGARTFVCRKVARTCGGMPLGSQGRVLLLLSSPKDIIAAFMVMKRGCTVSIACTSRDTAAKALEILTPWHAGAKIEVYLHEKNAPLNSIAKEAGALALVSGISLAGAISNMKKIEAGAGVQLLAPLIALDDKRISDIALSLGVSL